MCGLLERLSRYDVFFLLNFDHTASREYDVHSNNNIDDDLFWLGDKKFFFPKVDYDFSIRIFYVAAQAKPRICASMDGIIITIKIRP